MSKYLKLMGTEISLSADNSVGNAHMVRVYNDTAGAVLLTVKSGATTTGTVTLGPTHVAYIHKDPAQTIGASAAVKAVAMGIGG